MSRFLLKIVFFVCITNLFWSCERDDICPLGTITTPKLIIEFFDVTEPENNKIPPNLLVAAEDSENGFLFENTAEIVIPLRTDSNETIYNLTINSESEDGGVTNQVIFNYSTEEVYINRACGYKVEFFGLQATRSLESDPDNQWISNISVQETLINNELETHVYIFH
ncbi:DUF6452 family protein [Psychroflexus aestuariivivens]|uniref:DUF6452 family protein n=1 Tax=Psychroflexus aestuariivivens TaxID=1795040 RepID=UPI000FD6C72E|nr:DUF6452 family protein [Psychroflexus aestuariivivens]